MEPAGLRRFILIIILIGTAAIIRLSSPKNPSADLKQNRGIASTAAPAPSTSSSGNAPFSTPHPSAVTKPARRFANDNSEGTRPALGKLPQVEPVRAGNRSYALLAAQAVPMSLYQGPKDLILAEINGFAILPREEITSAQRLAFLSAQRPVLWNLNKRRAEIVSGTLIVQMKRPGRAQFLANRHGLQLLVVHDSIQTAFMRMKEGFDVFAGRAQLELDPEVARVELELLSKTVGPR